MRHWQSFGWGLAAALAIAGCDGGGLPDGWEQTPPDTGPEIRWDIEAEPLPEVPLPNDIATWPDPTSPTGRRVNASLVAPTTLESRTRLLFDQLDGWGTFSAITIPFGGPLDVEDMIDRQGGNRFGADDWPRHAVYLVDMETGEPVPLDVNGGNFQFALRDKDAYWDNDPRDTEPNIMFETVDEDADGDGRYDPAHDTDFDGVLDRPNTISGRRPACDDPRREGCDPPTVDQERRLLDDMLWFFERETNTLVLRPILPLEPQTEYAVVVTRRLRGAEGQPVRSPFPYVHHVSQKEELADLPSLLSEHPDLYGDLASRGWEGVAFAWTFTTQSVHGDLRALREGLYGRGSFARIAEDYPPDLKLAPLQDDRGRCDADGSVHIVPWQKVRETLELVGGDAFGVPPEQMEALLATYDEHVSHFAIGFFDTPYLLGDPKRPSVWETWQMDRQTGDARLSRDQVPMIIVVPKETEAHAQPFPVAFYGHGYTSMMIETLGFAGLLAQHGIASVGIDAVSHGLELDPGLEGAVTNIFKANCIEGMGQALLIDRAVDQNGDEQVDSAGDFWTSYVFHTRDVVRQSVLDHMQATRILRSFGRDGRKFAPGEIDPRRTGDEPIAFDGDLDGDGEPDLAGDFDGDGTPDIGGWENEYYTWGQSLGGILSGVLIGAEPAMTAAVPGSGAGGLIDVGIRTTQGGVREAVILRTMGPLIASQPSRGASERTACAEGDRSLRFVVPDVNDDVDVELACVPAETLKEGHLVIVRNLVNEEVRCAAAGADGRFRIGLPSDTGDRITVEIYDRGAERMRFGEQCRFEAEEQPTPVLQLDTWQVGNGASGEPGLCERCATYQGRTWALGDPLVTPTEGFGLPRQSPDLRRFLGLAQIALDPADPVNYAPHVFLDPIGVEDVDDGARAPRNVLVLNTLGDMNVPISAGNAYARAAGVLPFMPADAPDLFADYRAPADFVETYGVDTPNDVLIDNHVLEGVARLGRHPVPGGPADFLLSPDDLGEGKQWFLADGETQAPPDGEDPVFRPQRLDPPLRWVRASRAGQDGAAGLWDPTAGDGGMSGVLNAMVEPRGVHGFFVVDPSKVWDEARYLANLLGWYFASGGSELKYQTDPEGHHCLEQQSCLYGQ